MPSASATTCEVAAVPRNWQPPPGVPQARHPSDAASSSVIRPCAKRAPIDWILPASSPSIAGSVTPPGTTIPGRSAAPGQRQHRRRQPLVAGGDADHAGAAGQRSDQPPHGDGRVVAIGQAVEHARRALRAAVARIADVGGKRHDARVAQRLGRRSHQETDLPVAGVEAERDRTSVGLAQPALGADDEDLVPLTSAGFQPMPASWVMPNRLPLGSASSISGVIGRRPSGPCAFVRVAARSAPSPRMRSSVVWSRVEGPTSFSSVSPPIVMRTTSPCCSEKSSGGTMPVPVMRKTPCGKSSSRRR